MLISAAWKAVSAAMTAPIALVSNSNHALISITLTLLAPHLSFGFVQAQCHVRKQSLAVLQNGRRRHLEHRRQQSRGVNGGAEKFARTLQVNAARVHMKNVRGILFLFPSSSDPLLPLNYISTSSIYSLEQLCCFPFQPPPKVNIT